MELDRAIPGNRPWVNVRRAPKPDISSVVAAALAGSPPQDPQSHAARGFFQSYRIKPRLESDTPGGGSLARHRNADTFPSPSCEARPELLIVASHLLRMVETRGAAKKQ
jgi:hypothetical protein